MMTRNTTDAQSRLCACGSGRLACIAIGLTPPTLCPECVTKALRARWWMAQKRRIGEVGGSPEGKIVPALVHDDWKAEEGQLRIPPPLPVLGFPRLAQVWEGRTWCSGTVVWFVS